jgi:hypothetical protein
MSKIIIEVEIPDGVCCEDCQFVDGEFGVCVITQNDLKFNSEIHYLRYLKDPKCPNNK